MVDQKFAISVHIMTALAFSQRQNQDTLLTSDMLATSIRTNPTVVRRSVGKLVDSGLLQSFKGKAGGLRLARPAQQISLKEIYQASVSHTLLKRSKKAPKKQCPVSCTMGKLMSEVIDGVEENSLQYLSTIRLSDLVSKIKP